jgi:hypothetical protein
MNPYRCFMTRFQAFILKYFSLSNKDILSGQNVVVCKRINTQSNEYIAKGH